MDKKIKGVTALGIVRPTQTSAAATCLNRRDKIMFRCIGTIMRPCVSTCWHPPRPLSSPAYRARHQSGRP